METKDGQTDPAQWNDPDRVNMFDASLDGARNAFGRLNDTLGEETNLQTLIEIIWWLGAAIESMELQHGTGDLNAGIYWVRNRAAHFMWHLFKLIEPTRFPSFQSGFARYDDWVFDDIEVIGEDRDTIKAGTQRNGYVAHVEGQSVRMRLAICLTELDAWRGAQIHPTT